ncbi:MAG: hypothetical protein MOGMAGMI_02330 [Candidatus Omnitrophica bacterium]|nr:hypothetical protein [Candidatus Omnitrophota bacterium]
MKYLHIKNLDKYHPGYKDRNLQWCKAYFKMVNADPDFEMLHEIDKWRFIALVMLELQTKKPVPLDQGYLQRKGFNFKNRAMSLTLQMLHNFIEVGEEPLRNRNVEEEAVTEEKKESNTESKKPVTDEVWIATLKKDPTYAHVNIDQEIGKAKRWLELRPGRQFTRRFFINWINKIDKPIGTPRREAMRRCIICSKDWKESEYAAHYKACEEKFYHENPRGPASGSVQSLVAGVAQNLAADKGGKKP